ncbi:hypothetical protein NUBL21996_05730 [Klebsiella pneumoniae]|nr:hypothetical protein NUBL21996_05730 [Klebsiella pneumoniae]
MLKLRVHLIKALINLLLGFDKSGDIHLDFVNDIANLFSASHVSSGH